MCISKWSLLFLNTDDAKMYQFMQTVISLNVINTLYICFCISQSQKGLVDKKLRSGCYLYFEGQIVIVNIFLHRSPQYPNNY